jgi:hypothetical protein
MTRISIVLLTAVLTFGCGGNAPQNPVAPLPAIPSLTLSGVVTVPGTAGADPCEGARIRATAGTAVHEAYSGAGGRYTISVLPASTYTVTVTWPGFETAQRTVDLTQDTVVNFELQPRF